MQHVAADRHDQSFETAAPPADGERIEQRLGGMFMGAVAGIDHAAIQLARQQLGGAGILVAHDQNVGPHGVSVVAVSISVSPLETDEVLTDMFITSAPSRLPASSKLDWVRVEASKNRLMRVRPLSRAVFLSVARPCDHIGLGQVEQGGDFGERKAFDPKRWLEGRIGVASGDVIKAGLIAPDGKWGKRDGSSLWG